MSDTSAISAIKPDRRMAIEAMQSLGWTAMRTKPGKTVIWKFERPDTGGLWDVVKCRQDQISMRWVAKIAMQYGDAAHLVERIKQAEDEWLHRRFFGIYERNRAALGDQP